MKKLRSERVKGNDEGGDSFEIFSGKAEIICEGSPAYTLNLLTLGGIKVRNVKTDNDKTRFTLTEAELPQAEKILTENGREYTVTGVRGPKRGIREFFRRYALIVGVLISCALVYIYSTLVAEVEIRGLENVSESTVAEAVSEYVETPKLFAYPDLESIEKAVLGCDGVAYAKVVREGKRIIIEVVEELPEQEITDTQSPIPLLARESGTITRVVTLRGTAAVDCGDEVKAGDVLIAPYVEAGENAPVPVRAMGIVEARVTRTEQLEYADEASFTARAATDIEARKNEFCASLADYEIFAGSSFSVKKLDKSITISIYYEVITRIS